MDRTSVHTSLTLPSKWVGVETRLHISSTPSFKRPLHLSLNLSPSRLQKGFYMGQKSTRASHHLYGLGAISINNDKLADRRRPTTPAMADVEKWGGTLYLASTSFSCCAIVVGFFCYVLFYFFILGFIFKSDCIFEIHVVEFSPAADLTKIKSGLLMRLRGYLKKIKMTDLLIGVCLSSGQMCGQSKRQWINLANAAASDL